MKPTVPEVQSLVEAFYKFPENAVGGVLHIVLDDGNISDGDVKHCIEAAHEGKHWANPTPGQPDEAGELLGRLILKLSKTQRKKLDGYNSTSATMKRDYFIAECKRLLDKYGDLT